MRDVGAEVRLQTTPEIYEINFKDSLNTFVDETTSLFEKVNESIDYVAIHGAGNYELSDDHFRNLFCNICHAHGEEISPRMRTNIVDGLDQYSCTTENQKRVINFYNIRWNPITKKLRKLVYSLDEDEYRFGNTDYLKKNYIIGFLGDLALYQNDSIKNEISNFLQKCFKVIHSEYVIARI